MENRFIDHLKHPFTYLIIQKQSTPMKKELPEWEKKVCIAAAVALGIPTLGLLAPIGFYVSSFAFKMLEAGKNPNALKPIYFKKATAKTTKTQIKSLHSKPTHNPKHKHTRHISFNKQVRGRKFNELNPANAIDKISVTGALDSNPHPPQRRHSSFR